MINERIYDTYIIEEKSDFTLRIYTNSSSPKYGKIMNTGQRAQDENTGLS